MIDNFLFFLFFSFFLSFMFFDNRIANLNEKISKILFNINKYIYMIIKAIIIFSCAYFICQSINMIRM